MADCSIAHCCSGCCVLVHTSSQFCSALGGETRRDIMCMCKQTQLTWMRSETGLTLMNLPINRACKAPGGEHHYHVREMQRTRVRLWKRVFNGLWRPFSSPYATQSAFLQLTASSVCSVMVREHMLCSYGLKKTFFPLHVE